MEGSVNNSDENMNARSYIKVCTWATGVGGSRNNTSIIIKFESSMQR